jgi:hypothetical protein
VLVLALSGTPALAVSPANEPFERTWARTDQPVAEGQINRTWMWGPAAFTELMNEPYGETPEAARGVQYFDKSRMEITDPTSDPNSIWHVTNGLLVVEMVTGRIQTGAVSFEDAEPAMVNVAGDAGDPNGPTYTTMHQLLEQAPHDAGQTITSRLDRAAQSTDDPGLAVHGVTAAELVPETNHRVASIFWDFMISDGLVYGFDGYTEDRLFQNPFYATGFPISEAYWATIQVAGTSTDVLLQCFERRCLTYTPGNDDGWQVEAGNVGRHYYEWRHGPVQIPTSGDVRVTDVFFDPVDEGDRSGEYVTIQNFDPYPVDLTGWTLTDEGPRATYVVPPFVFQPGASLRIYNCTGADTLTELYTGRCSAWWNNDGDIASLFTATGTLVSQYEY